MISIKFWGCEMQILFNELSLDGQFQDEEAFISTGLVPFIKVLKEMQSFAVLLLKKSDVWKRNATPSQNLHSLLVGSTYRAKDEIRRFKSALASLTKEPFWDSETRQNTETAYYLESEDVSGSSLAEACERDKSVVSFVKSKTSFSPIFLKKQNEEIALMNLTATGELTDHLWETRKISFEAFLKSKFSGNKLDFTYTENFSVQIDQQNLLIDTFLKFEKMSWDQIYTDSGLNYKEFHSVIDFRFKSVKTYKFRASGKIRCHGYRERNTFFVLKFETDHKMSDKG